MEEDIEETQWPLSITARIFKFASLCYLNSTIKYLIRVQQMQISKGRNIRGCQFLGSLVNLSMYISIHSANIQSDYYVPDTMEDDGDTFISNLGSSQFSRVAGI